MISLFLDTSSSHLVIGIVKQSEILFFLDEIVEEMSVVLFSKLEEAFSKVHLTPDDIDIIYVVTGPGSFTGTRIGLTVMKIYACFMNKKIVPISSLEVMATLDTTSSRIVSVIDARHGYVFAGVYHQDLSVIMEDQYISLDDLLKKYSTDSVFVSRDSFSFSTLEPKIDLLRILKKHQYDEGVNPNTLCPNYLKKTQAEENLYSNL